MAAYIITEQPGAAPGYEWLYEIPVPHHHSVASAAVCGTASTREECDAEARRTLRQIRGAA